MLDDTTINALTKEARPVDYRMLRSLHQTCAIGRVRPKCHHPIVAKVASANLDTR